MHQSFTVCQSNKKEGGGLTTPLCVAAGGGGGLPTTRFFKIQTQVDKSHVSITTGEDQSGGLLNKQLFVEWRPQRISSGTTRDVKDQNSGDII